MSNETRREHLIRLGKVGFAGFSTIFLLKSIGTDKIIKSFSQKDPNSFMAGIDYDAYNMFVEVQSPGGRIVKVINWLMGYGPMLGYDLYRGEIGIDFGYYPTYLQNWCDNFYSSALSFKPYYGNIYKEWSKLTFLSRLCYYDDMSWM